MRFLLFVVDELGGGCCGVGGVGGVVAAGGAVLLYYDCEIFVGVGFWEDWSDLSDGSDGSDWSDWSDWSDGSDGSEGREPRGWFLWQPRAAAFLFLATDGGCFFSFVRSLSVLCE